MNSFCWNYGEDWQRRGKKNVEERKAKNTKLVIDEDSIYEIDLDCIECMKKGKESSS